MVGLAALRDGLVTHRFAHHRLRTSGRCEEVTGELVEECLRVSLKLLGHLLSTRFVERPLGVLLRLHHHRGHSSGEHDAVQSLLAVPRDVSGDFASAHGKSDEGDVLEVQLVEEPGKVIGERVVVVPSNRLIAAAEAAAVVGDDSVAAPVRACFWFDHASAFSGQPWMSTRGGLSRRCPPRAR